MHPLVLVVEILEKMSTGKFGRRGAGKSVNFSALETPNVRYFLAKWINKRKETDCYQFKKLIITEEKRRKMTIFNQTLSLPKPRSWGPDLIWGSAVIVIPYRTALSFAQEVYF